MPTMFFVNDSTGYLAGSDGSFAYQGAIARTADAGQNWSMTILPPAYTLINSIHFPNPDTGFATTRYGDIYRTVTAGAIWDSVATLSTASYSQIFFPTSTTGYVITDTTIYKTTDAGLSWAVDFTVASGGGLRSLTFADSITGFIVGGNGTIVKTPVVTGIENINSDENKFSVFPNPASGNLIIQNNTGLSFQLEVYNSIGEKIMAETFSGRMNTINLSSHSNGIYFYKAIEHNKKITTGKLIKL